MTTEQIVVNEITKHISELPVAQGEACLELAEFFRMNIKRAGEPVGTLALALVGAELQLKNSR